MKKNSKNGFTLVELLAVIAVLGLILIIAVPKVMDVLNTQKKRTLELTARSIIKAAEEKYIENTSYGITEEITCEGISNITRSDFESCEIEFDGEGYATVTINGKGRYEDLSCRGTKEAITCQKGPILKGLNCTYNGELVQGAEFVHNQYTYRYMQELYYYVAGDREWVNIDEEGWGVVLTDLESTAPVNTPVCSYINGKPLVSMSNMFGVEGESEEGYPCDYGSAATIIDVSNWDTDNVVNMYGMFMFSNATQIVGLDKLETSKVTDMSGMFDWSAATNLDLSSFDTSKVTDMSYMFFESAATSLDLSSFETSKVTDMSYMFEESAATSLDLSSFDTSNVTDMSSMFWNSAATIGYARNQTEADKFNDADETGIPDTLTFIVKPSS